MTETLNKNLIGVIGDLHMKDFLSYGDHISDRRVGEKKEVLDFIVNSFFDCKYIVLLGDVFNSKNNSSETNREFVEFIERFDDKEIFIISGNHSKKGDGKTALDFLKEVKKTNWHIFTKPYSHMIEGKNIQFLPYMLNSELSAENTDEATQKIMNILTDADLLFTHHAISGTTFLGLPTESFKEVVLPKEELEKKYKLIMAGHIHEPQSVGKVIISGSVFTNTVGEIEKYIWKIKEDLSVEQIKLPNRELHKITNPTLDKLSSIKEDSIVKVILTDKEINVKEIKKALEKFDASLLIENYPSDRKKVHIEEGAFDFSIESLLELYSKEKKVNYQELLKGLQIINEETN